MKSPAQVLRDAADLCERGWCQHEYRDGDQFCMSGALMHAGATSAYQRSESAARSILYRLLDMSLSRWNDAPERTQAEVVAKLREAADLAEQEASHV